jgi:glycosyltransferase involved in cell wall biosynthesis
MRFTIVTLSFNQRRFLEEALRSVLDQDYPQVEYVVVDPGSTDGSRELVSTYRSRLARVILEPDAGPADGLNKGFAHATGDVLGVLNADDVLLPGALASVARAFAARDADVVTGDGFIVDEAGRAVRRFRSDRFHLRRYVFGGVNVMQQATFFTRAAFGKAGGFNEANRTCWDGELLVDLALSGARFTRIRENLALFRVHGESISGSQEQRVAYEADRDRIARRVLDRTPSGLERAWARGAKWSLDPAGAALRVVEKVMPPAVSR